MGTLEKQKKSKTIQVHSFLIILAVVLITAIMTHVVPAGSFQRVYNEELNRNIVVAGSFEYLDERNPCTIFGFFTSIYNAYVNAADLLFFVIFAFAYTGYLTKTKSLDALVTFLKKKLGNNDKLLIPLFMLIFSLFGSILGLYEETYGLIPPIIAIALSLGYDRIVGGAMLYVGLATGFAAAMVNPFTIGLASTIAEIPMFAPKITVFRIAVWVIMMGTAIIYTMRYAGRVKRDLTKSYLYIEGAETDSEAGELNTEFTLGRKLSLLILLVVVAALSIGCVKLGWYLAELSALFLIGFILTAVVNGATPNEICDIFVEGAKESIFAVILIGITRAISIIMIDASIIDTIVNALAGVVSILPSFLYGVAMFIVQTLINFFIPSGSGQALATMPIMVPVGDLLGLAREVTVTAFQFGDGFSNLIWPTMTVSSCAIMRIPLDKWYKFIVPLYGIMVVIQAIFITLACQIF